MGDIFGIGAELLSPGTPAPRFNVETSGQARFDFDSLGGRYTVLGFVGGAGEAAVASAIGVAQDASSLFDPARMTLFWINGDARYQALLKAKGASVRVLSDFDHNIDRLFALRQPAWVVLDPRLRVIKSAPLDQASQIFAFLRTLPPPDLIDGDLNAPVLITPRVFDRELCRRLIEAFETGQSAESGFMRQVDGREMHVVDAALKRRRDLYIEDEDLRDAVRGAIAAKLIPEIARAFSFAVTRMERDLVACYDADPGGFFKPHRDNTSAATAHRRFAVTINLNAEDYDGGDLRFPEFGARRYRAPTGGAVVFSCSLMHEATPVTRGRRYAFLPFLYDEAGETIRLANEHRLTTRPNA